MLKHIVCWKLNGSPKDREAVAKRLSQMMEGLKPIIPEILSVAVGTNLCDGDCFHVCVDSVFDNAAALDHYLYHPEHVKVKDYMASVSYDKMVFDYSF